MGRYITFLKAACYLIPIGSLHCFDNSFFFFLHRADNWRVDSGADPVEHKGLTPFGKVSSLQSNGAETKLYDTHSGGQLLMIILESPSKSVREEILNRSTLYLYCHNNQVSVEPRKRN